MSDQLHQINIAYMDKEDRLLMRTTTQKGDEYRVWFTRRYAGLLMEVLNKFLKERGGMTTVGSTPQATQMLKEGALEKPFEKKAANYPLGEDGFLAYAIKTTVTEDKILNLQMLPEKGQGFTLNLSSALLYMFHNLLTQGITKADWNFRQDPDAAGSGKIH